MSDFWARRKAAVEAETRAEDAAAQVELEVQNCELDGLSDAEVLEKLELPDPDTLGEGDDFKVFWAKAVPSRIRTRALRRLWRVNPILANVDGLIDYGEDFTDAALVVEGMETAYQVGKGMTAHVEELARQAAEQDAVAPDTLEAEAGAEALPQDIALEAPDAVVATQDVQPASVAIPTEFEEDELPPAPMGRMRFRFEETAQT